MPRFLSFSQEWRGQKVAYLNTHSNNFGISLLQYNLPARFLMCRMTSGSHCVACGIECKNEHS